jgi:hypothetical protein
MRSKLSTVAVGALLLLSLPPVAAARLPAGFFGISPQTAPSEPDYELMERAGVKSVRLPLLWAQVEQANPLVRAPDWSGFDLGVEIAARHGMRIFPFLTASPAWISPRLGLEPVGRWQLRAWADFLYAAVSRYGDGGSFWAENPELPYRPVRAWEVWNEENIVTFGRADPEGFARLLRASGRAIHAADRGAKVILGGLFGRPLQVPPNATSGGFLSGLYRSGGLKPYFDGVALHPYVADVSGMRAQLINLRRIMRLHGDSRTPIYVTELGWGSRAGPTRWERGLEGQAEQLTRAFEMLSANRIRWRIGGAWWFTWSDEGGTCAFCGSAGLLTTAREAKPAWYRFNEWTGGDPDTVPRATIGN